MYLVTIDTLRADHVHCYGYERIQTPALDDLARDGIRFAQAFTPSPITRIVLMPVLRPACCRARTGLPIFARPAGSQTSDLGRTSQNGNGYQTGAFIGAVILDSKVLAPGLDRGFDFYDNFPEHSLTKSRWGRVERRGSDVAQRAIALAGRASEGPAFRLGAFV